MTAEERDQRTVFILQIARSTRPRDLEEFFSSVGNVRDVRIITDSRTGRSKGIAYVEFWEEDSVSLALALNGQKLIGAPLVIQRTCAERNRAANAPPTNSIGLGAGSDKAKTKLSITNLHTEISEEMLTGVMEPFGRVEKVQIFKDSTGASRGIALVEFRHSEDAQKALEQLNGFELANKAIRVTFDDDEDPALKAQLNGQGTTRLDNIVEERVGVAGARAHVMANLAARAGMQMPGMPGQPPAAMAMAHVAAPPVDIPAIATQCFMLSNMFDPARENEPGWADDVRDDVVEECSKNGGALHVYVDQASAQGNVYVKCPTVEVAYKSVNTLHGRWFSGKVITANYVPVNSYHELFPAAKDKTIPIVAGTRGMAPPPPAPIPPPPPAGYMQSFY